MSGITYKSGREPHAKEHRVVFRNVDRNGWDTSLKTYMSEGGYEQLQRALKMPRQEIVDEVKRAGLRGRGGA